MDCRNMYWFKITDPSLEGYGGFIYWSARYASFSRAKAVMTMKTDRFARVYGHYPQQWEVSSNPIM